MKLQVLSPTFKPVLQQASWVNTNFWKDHFTRESRHTRDVLNLLQKFARVDKTGNLNRFCCKTVELLVNQFFYNLQQPHFLQDMSNSWVVKRATSLLILQQLMLQIKLHIFRSPFYRIFTYLICVNQMKIIRNTSGLWNFTVCSELSKFIRLKIVLTFFSWMLVVIAHPLS